MDANQPLTGQQAGLLNSQEPGSVHSVPIVEEQLHLGKKTIETGKIHVSKKVIEKPFEADMPVFKEEVIVERKPVNKYVDDETPGIRMDGETTIIPVIKEVIIKRILLVEEIYITKRRVDSTAPVNEVLRSEEVVINRTGGTGLNDTPNDR